MAKIVRISDMTDDEKKKWKEQVSTRNEELISNRQKEQERANQLFNEYVSKNGANDTTKHTTTIGDLEKAYKNYSNYETVKKSLDTYYEANKGKDIIDDLIGVGSNAIRSLANLGINARENIGRRMKTDLNNRFNEINETNYRIGYNALKERGYSEEEINDVLNNSFELKTSDGFNNFTNKMSEINQTIENKFSEWENANNQKIQENIENASNPISKKVLELTPSITQSSVNLIPGGQIVFASGTTQNYYEEAKNERGMSDEEADKYASIMSTMETVSEAIGAKLTKNVGKSLVKKNVKEAFVNYGLDIGENFLEEAIMEPTSELTTTIVAGEEKANWDNMGQRMLNAGINGALSSILMGGASAGVGSAVNVVNKISNGQTVTQSEIQTAMKDIQESEVLDVEGILKSEIQKSINNTSNLQQNSLNNQTNLQGQQITQSNNIMAQNQNMEQIDNTLPVANEKNRYTKSQLDEMLNNKELPMQSYQYEKSDNVKINNLRQDANKYFNNSEKARNYVNMLEKIITDKNIDIRLDANLKTADGRIANGSYSNGVITINPNSTRAGEFIAIHELTHAIGTKSMIDMVENYRKSNTEFDLAVEQLLQNYNTSEINEEALADVSAQLFGNQEFINNIAQENPSIFKKIYSEIKYLWHQFRGYKNQQQFIDDLYYKWTQTYNSNNKLNTHNSYAIETNDKGYKYVRADRQVISGNNPEVWKEQAKNYIDEKIRNNKDVKVYAQDGTELTITKNTSGKATFRNEVRQADGTIRKLTDEEFASKLRAETHIDELGQISTHKNGPVVDTKNHDFAKDGFTYRNAYFEDIDGQYYKITMSVGKNGDINTIYNVGKMQQAQKNRSNSTNRGFKDPNGNNTASSRISSINSITNSNEDVNTTTKYSIQESENNSGSFSMKDNQGRTLTKEQQEYFKDSKVRDENGNLLTVYHGTQNGGFTQFKNYTYFTDNNDVARTYSGSIENITKDTFDSGRRTSIGNYEGYINLTNPFEIDLKGSNWDEIDITKINISNIEKLLKEHGISTYENDGKVYIGTDDIITIVDGLNENGANYDGIILKNIYDNGARANNNNSLSNDYIIFNKNQFKSIDNTSPTSNPDIRYSQNTLTWQQYLDKNFKSEGTKTNLQDIKLPTAPKQVAPSMANNKLETGEYTKKQKEQIKSKNQYEQYNEYKKNILKRRANEVNNLISYKNQTIRNIDNKIIEKQNLLNSKKNKDTKVANTLKTQIEKLKTQKTKIENLYNEKIDKVNDKTNKEKIDFETRNSMKKLARETLKEEISPLIEDMTIFKDKKAGWLYNRETAQRNIEDIVKDKEKANIINETIFNPIQKHQAEKTREINRLFSTINELKLDKSKRYEYFVKEINQPIKIDEATLAQLLIEKKISNEDLKNKYNMTDIQIAKINKTANTFSGILDYLYDKMNEEQIKYGYSPIGKIKNYFPHFFENKPDTMLGKIASYFGIDVTKQNLPTDIAGITDTFKPGRTWNSNILQRKTDKTDYDALKAMERYIIGATDIIYTTEDIQKIRAFEREIRYKYSDKGIQEEIDKIWNDKELTQEAKDNAIEGIFKDKENELSNFVTWLNDYGNSLANKKAFSDRNMERNIGRNLYSSMSGIESRIASNTIGGNLSVSLTNFAPLFQAMGSTKVNYVLTGMLQTTQNNIKGIIGKKDVNFADNSTFLTNRFGTDTISKRTVSQNISDKASILMNTIDAFTSESIVRAKYLENLDSGMVEEQALNNADKYASRLMGDRSKGALPLVFNSKNPLSKLVTMFQVEPNNIVSNYLKDMPRNTQNKGELTWQASKLMVASYAFNTLVMAIRGGNEVLPDPIRWVSYLITAMTGDDEEREKAKEDLAESVIGSTPFISNAAGLFGMEDIGRVPISNAMPDLSIIGKLTDKEISNEYKKEILLKEVIKPFLYLGLPTGGAQIKKTVEGISTIASGGSYKTDKNGNKNLQFPVENANIGSYIKAGIFGKYSLSASKEYAERGYKSLNAKQTKMYEESKLSYSELTSYMDAELNKKEDKINYISSQNWNDNQKWTIYKYDIFSSDERKDGGSQLSDAEYITNNGVSKKEFIEIYNSLQKNNIDVPTESEYKEIKSSGLSLKTYADYKINIKNKKQEKKNTNELTEKQSLKDTDKIQIILDSNYSNKEKTALYENYILSSQDETYPLIKQFFTDDGLNINKYLEYKTQGFASDIKDDGTVDGKSISGSKKKKVYDYVADMKISYTQRLVLLGTQYKLERNQRTTLFNYINSSSLKNSEKLELLGKMEGFTVYKDGTVEW